MRPLLVALVVGLFAASVRAETAQQVTAITKEGRYGGTLSVTQVEVKTNSGLTKVPFSEVASIQFGDAADVVRTRQGKRVKGVIRVEGWTIKEKDSERPLARGDLRYIVPRVPIGPLKRGKTVDAATANGMTYHLRVPDKYDPN